jgi:hypothetical protein
MLASVAHLLSVVETAAYLGKATRMMSETERPPLST